MLFKTLKLPILDDNFPVKRLYDKSITCNNNNLFVKIIIFSIFPLNLFEFRTKVVNDFKFKKEDGIVLFKKLFPILSEDNFVIVPYADGIVPLNEFCCKNKEFNFVNFDNCKGKVPVNELENNCKNAKFVNKPKVVGIVDVNKLSRNEICCKLVNVPRIDGMDPTNEFTLKWNKFNLDNFPS